VAHGLPCSAAVAQNHPVTKRCFFLRHLGAQSIPSKAGQSGGDRTLPVCRRLAVCGAGSWHEDRGWWRCTQI